MQPGFRAVFTGILLLVITTAALAQDTTPTPAPTKTPAQSESEDEGIILEPTNSSTGSSPAFTQENLTVITGNVQRPNGIVWFGSLLYVICNGDWTVYEIDSQSGSTRTYIYGVRNGHTLYAEGDEDTNQLTLWVPDFDTNSLMQVNPVRSPQPVASNLTGPWGIDLLDEERFLVTMFNGNNISIISRGREVQPVVQDLNRPTGIAVEGDYGYVANSGSARRAIEWFNVDDLEGASDVELQPLVSGLQSVTNVVMAPDNYLYFTYALGTRGVVGRVNPDDCRSEGGCTNDEVEIVVYTELTAPLAGLSISPDMRLFVHTMFRPEIYWVQLPQAVASAQ